MIHIGTSRWYYEHWRGPFYPKELADEAFLDYYKKHFGIVEINIIDYSLKKWKTL